MTIPYGLIPLTPRDATATPAASPPLQGMRTLRPTPQGQLRAPEWTVRGKLREMLNRTASQYARAEDAAMAGNPFDMAAMLGPMAMGKIAPSQLRRVAAGDVLDGFTVGPTVHNTESVGATMPGPYRTLGLREIPMAEMDQEYVADVLSRPLDARRSALSALIQQNKRIDPLIVAYDKIGPYVVEGSHRIDALAKMGVKRFPALVVEELDP